MEQVSTVISRQRRDSTVDTVICGLVQGEAGDVCALCGEQLYILERLCADGRFFHRSCFRCHVCEATLWPGGYQQHLEDGE